MNLEEVKKFIHVDFPDDDSYITLLIDVAKEYIVDAVGSYKETIARHKLLLVTIVYQLYENRMYAVDDLTESKSQIISSIVTQLQLDEII